MFFGWKERKCTPQKYPRFLQLHARSRMAISDTDRDGRRRLLVYVRPDSLGGCLDDWLPGQCDKGLVGLSCVRPSRAAVSIQIGRPGKPHACFEQAEAGWTVGRAAPHRFGGEPSDPLYRLIEKCVELYSQGPAPCMGCKGSSVRITPSRPKKSKESSHLTLAGFFYA